VASVSPENSDDNPGADGPRSSGGAATSALILLVEDDVRSARILVRMLRDDGYDVELATDGAAAIARLTRRPLPDVLVTDLRMPHADGEAVARYARSLEPSMPVLLVTGYPEMAARIEGPMRDDITVLTKPLDYAELVADIRKAIGLRP
jgi:CheY-like chemotaxis protein